MYLSYHSYGEKIVYPWSYTDRPVPDWRDLHRVAARMAARMHRASDGRSRFKVGSAPEVQYLANGGSDDWVRGVAGVK